MSLSDWPHGGGEAAVSGVTIGCMNPCCHRLFDWATRCHQHDHMDQCLLVERLRQGSGHVPVRGVFFCDGIERYGTHEREYGCVQRTGGRGSEGERGRPPTPSVRRVQGTDVPVFARSAVSNPHDPLPVELTSEASQLRHDRRGVARGTLTGGCRATAPYRREQIQRPAVGRSPSRSRQKGPPPESAPGGPSWANRVVAAELAPQ